MINQFTGVGNITDKPTLKYTGSGTAVAEVTVCCEHGWGDNKKTEFVRCVAFSKLAEIMEQYSEKGNKVFVQGSMQTDKYESNGETKYSTKIILDTFKNLSPRSQTGDGVGSYEQQDHSTGNIPF